MADARRTTRDRQIELTDAALDIVATDGVTALTTRRLAARVGLSSGAIFKHFTSLDALLEAVVARIEAVLDATYPDPALPPLERLERFVEARSAAVGDRIGILRLVLSDQFRLALPADGARRVASCVSRTHGYVRECLRAAQRDGAVRADLTSDALAPIVMGTVQMLALSAGRFGGPHPEARAVRDALSTLLRPHPPADAGEEQETP